MIIVTHIITSRSGIGPVHAMDAHDGLRQALCGVRPLFRHRVSVIDSEAVTCRKCLTAIRRGLAYSRRRR